MSKVDGFTEYGAIDKDTAREDLFMIVKNTGTYAAPLYPAGTSRKSNQDKFKEVLNVPLTVRVEIPPASVKTLFTVPYEIVPAPGGDYFIDPISCFYDFVYNSVAWNNGSGNIYLKTDTGTIEHLKSDEAVLHLTADSSKKMHHVDGDLGEIIENKGLFINADADSTATGNSLLVIYLTYQIHKRNP